MPTSCCVQGCTSKWGRDGVKFHRFPTDPLLKKKWIKNLNLNFIPKNQRVCSIHFAPNSLNPSGRVRRNCFPSMFTTLKYVTTNINTPMEHNYSKRRCSFQETLDNLSEEYPLKKIGNTNLNHQNMSDEDIIQNIETEEITIETGEIQNQISSNQLRNLKKENQENKFDEKSEINKVKMKCKILQQNLRRCKQKLAKYKEMIRKDSLENNNLNNNNTIPACKILMMVMQND